MKPAVDLLELTGEALREALARRDWLAIGELDRQCREAVEAAMVEPLDADALQLRMQELLALYRQLVTTCQQEQQRLAVELTQLNQGRQGAKVYQLFG